MASSQAFLEGFSDEESDANRNPRTFNEQSRISTLGTYVSIPNSDMPASEGNEGISAMTTTNSKEVRDGHRVLRDTVARNPPEVVRINSPIGSGTASYHVASASTSDVPRSSVPGKLSRPAAKKPPSERPRREIKTGASPEQVYRSPPQVPPAPLQSGSRKPPTRRNHNVRKDVRNQDNNSSRKSPPPRAGNQSSQKFPSQGVASSLPLTQTIHQIITRSAGSSGLQHMDLTKPLKAWRGVAAKKAASTSAKKRTAIMSPIPSNTHPMPSVDTTVDVAASNRPPSPSVEMIYEPTSSLSTTQHVAIATAASCSPNPDTQHQVPATREASSLSQAVDVQPTVAKESQRSHIANSALFITSAPASRAQLLALLERGSFSEHLAKAYGDNNDDDVSNDGDTEFDDHRTESCHSVDIHMPKELEKALGHAHIIHEKANKDSLRQDFGKTHVLRSYSSLKKTVGRWEAENDHSKTETLIGLSKSITKEAKAIFQNLKWDRDTGLEHIYRRMLPTLVRMLYVSLKYYLAGAKTLNHLQYEPLKESRAIAKAVVNLSRRAKATRIKFTRPQVAVEMIARIKDVHKILERHLITLEQANIAAEYAQKQQTQQQQWQKAIDFEEEEEWKLKQWKEKWRVLHVQRLGAELEGRICLSPDKDRHLRHVPIEDTSVEYPYWDPDAHVYPLAEGLREFAGPDVYRKVFRKYCCQGGLLQAFNVSEIIDKAVSLRDQLIKMAVEDGEDQEQWVVDIPDPRKPSSEALR